MTMPARRTVVFLAIVMLTLGTAWFVTRVPSDEDLDSSGGRAGARDVVQEYPVGERPEVDPFEVVMLDGSKLSESDLRGTVTVLNIAGTA